MRHITDIREERIPACKYSHTKSDSSLTLFYFTDAKQLRISAQANQFIKAASVFRDWHEDNDKRLREAFYHDTKYWKLKRIINSYEDQAKVTEIFRQNYEAIKSIFISSVVDSLLPPDFKRTAFLKFAEKAGITDRKVNTGIIDTYFKATNYEALNQDQNDDNALIRFEFLEIIIRLAKGKYLETGRESSIVLAVQKTLTNHILPMKGQVIKWQEFRDSELWCHEVNDLLEVNLRGLRRLYDMIAGSKFNQKKNRVPQYNLSIPTIDQFRQVLINVIPGVGETKIIQAFYLSKQTVIQENIDGDYEYTHMTFAEFMEFIGRLA